MSQTIEVKNIGPVEQVSIPVPEGGGIVVLKGRNGSGKTQTLRAIESAATGRGRPSVRDGALRGEINGLGVTIKVGRSTRRTGELEVETLEGKLNVATLVDPGLKSDDAADARRIKALVGLAGVKADPTLFHDLFGGEQRFREIVKAASIDTEDPVLLAERIKRDAEEAARQEESKAEHAQSKSLAKLESAKGVDLEAESDAELLQQQLEEALSHQSALRSRKEQADKMAAEVAEAKRRIADLEEYRGPTAAEALAAFNDASNAVDDAHARVHQLERELAEAKQQLEMAVEKRKSCDAVHKSAVHHEQVIQELNAVIERDRLAAPTEDELREAESKLAAVREAVELGVLVRRAKEARREAEELHRMALTHAEAAQQLREAAKGTDEVLSSIVAQTNAKLRVEAGRLVLATKRGTTCFSDLSHGERWRIALDIAIDAVGENGLLVIDQEAWEGLDPINRAELAEHVRGRGVVILTAEASDAETIVPEVV